MMRRLAIVGGFCVCTLVGLSAQTSARKHYVSSDTCGFAFDHPADWIPNKVGSSALCGVRLATKDRGNGLRRDGGLALDSLEVRRERGRFLEALSRNLFDFVKGRWVVFETPGSETDATVVMTDRWEGLRGVVTSRCYEPSLGIGQCEEPNLVLLDADGRIWSMRGGAQSHEPFELVLATFRFVDH
jgi:hypothetical protein